MDRGRDPHIHKYLWRDVGESAFAGWQLTLKDDEAIAFLAFTAILLVYAHTRVWVLVRAGVQRLTRPIQLPDDDEAHALSRLTQKEAFSSLLRDAIHSRRTHPRHVGNRTMITVSPLFGIASVLAVAVFLSCEVVVPWLLTGSLETPIVQSQAWDRCYENDHTAVSLWTQEQIAYHAADKYQRCWFNTSLPTSLLPTCGRENGVLFDRPEMHVRSTNISCPFSPKACRPGSSPLQLEYVNVSLRDVGLNVKSDVLFSRRVTCSPLNLDHFLLNASDGTTWLHFAVENSSSYESGAIPILRQRLTYSNGRNPPPSNLHWLEGRTPDLRYWTATADLVHPDLFRPDGETFILIYDAGRAVYRKPINDPMYSAHNRLRNQGREYWPDYEYTAMACHEQHRFCLHNGPCTPFSSPLDLSTACFRLRHYRLYIPRPSGPFWEAVNSSSHLSYQACSLLSDRGPLGTIGQFVSARGVSAMLSFERSTWTDSYVPVDPEGQWILDVKAWFESSFLMLRQGLLLPVMGDPTPWVKSKEARDVLCGKVLMIHGDYTNINFAGFLLTLGVVVTISGCNHGKRVSRVWGRVKKWVVFATWRVWGWYEEGWRKLVSLQATTARDRHAVGDGEARRTGDHLDENFELR
jgi:hypothetical protein